jgi:hypothetical protein
MPTLFLDFDPPEPCPYAFTGDTSDIVYFLSFAFSGRYLPVRPACPAGRQAGGSAQSRNLWDLQVPQTVLL